MNIQDLVPDLKICQEAKDKGVVIESKYYWWHRLNDSKWMISPFNEIFNENYSSAPLTDEILKVLPREIIIEGYTSLLLIAKNEKTYTAGYETDEDELYFIEDKKLSNALLLLAIKLKEEGIIN